MQFATDCSSKDVDEKTSPFGKPFLDRTKQIIGPGRDTS